MQKKNRRKFRLFQGFSDTFHHRFWSKVNKNGPIQKHVPNLGRCWVWTGSKSIGGYGQFWCGKFAGNLIYSHRASWIIRFGVNPGPKQVLHKCDNPACVRPSHLFLGNALINHLDAVKKGRAALGSKHPNSKISESQVLEIISMLQNGVLQKVVASKFGISQGSVSRILYGGTWRHLANHRLNRILRSLRRFSPRPDSPQPAKTLHR